VRKACDLGDEPPLTAMYSRAHACSSTETTFQTSVDAPTPGKQTLTEDEPSAAEATNGNHVVRRGETLLGLSRRYELALRRLVAANPQLKDPDNIYPDQVVRLPATSGY
jgi:nucleoid-associated protein YgaU